MADTSTKFERVMFELKPRPVSVKSVEDLAPNYRRIVVEGESLADFQSLSPSDHIKLLLDIDGEKIRRDYTPRGYGNNELTLEFAIHANGPFTNWARSAKPGDGITVLGPRGSMVMKPVFDGFVLIGDDTLLPAVGRALSEWAPGTKVVAVIEIAGEEDKIELPTETDATIVWAIRGNREPGAAMVEALAATEVPEGEVLFYAGGEATAMRDVRRHLLNERGVNRGNISVSGHWKQGQSDFDHHAEIEE